eukprot:c11944_g1_i1.p1 GENE.c11944_g1_i1~~c11944_g1_i1.p1  ORF type:complete len:955 (-),score=191.22 c11944_g1_i1:1367-4231(-)
MGDPIDEIFTPRTNALLGLDPQNPFGIPMPVLQMDPEIPFPSVTVSRQPQSQPQQSQQFQSQQIQPQQQLKQLQPPSPQHHQQPQQQQPLQIIQPTAPLFSNQIAEFQQLPLEQMSGGQMNILVQTMLNCFQQMTNRIHSLESSVTMIQDMLSDQKKMGNEVASFVDCSSAPSPSSASETSSSHHAHSPAPAFIPSLPQSQSPPVSNIPTSPESTNKVNTQHNTSICKPVSPPTSILTTSSANGGEWKYDYELVLEGVADEFYSERPFPPFTVRVVDTTTRDVYTCATEWQLKFRLLDGYGRYIDTKLADEKTKMPYLTSGETLVSGLRFMQVSSKNGGYFVLECELQSPVSFVSRVQKVRTQNITIMSCRLYNQRKSGSFSRLSGLDPVSKLPGIGRQYHLRLCEAGLRTIQDLASLPDSPEGRAIRQQLLDKIRKDQGSLTEAKFLDYIKTAKAIVSGAILTRKAHESGGMSDGGESFSVGKEERGHKRCHDDIEPEEIHHFGTADPFSDFKRVAQTIPESSCEQYLGRLGEASTYDISARTSPVSFSYDQSPFFCDPNAQITRSAAIVVIDEEDDKTSSKKSRLTRRNSNTEMDSTFPLHFAVATGRIAVLQRIIIHIADINPNKFNEFNAQEFTPLMFACALGHEEIVQLLTETKGVDLDTPRMDGWTSLHMAVLNRHNNCVQALLAKGANPIPCTVTQWTPLMMAVLQGHDPSIQTLKHTISMTSHQLNGVGLLHLAILSNSINTLNSVLEALVSTNQTDKTEAKNELIRSVDKDTGSESRIPTLMHCAAFCGNEEIMKVLIDAGVSSHTVTCVGGWLPLHVAAFRANTACLRLLLKLPGVNVNVPTSDGWTALSIAAMGSERAEVGECTEVLVAAGAKNEGSTIPASVVSVVCSNLDSLMVLANGRPDKMEHTVTIKDKQVKVTTQQLGRSFSKDVMRLCEALGDDTS